MNLYFHKLWQVLSVYMCEYFSRLSSRKRNGIGAGDLQYFGKRVNFEAAADNFPTVLFIILKN